jgi:DsbC/DsbD-like thiol-disulfide interchange protein
MNRKLLLLFLLSSLVAACSSAGTEKSGNAPQAANTNKPANANGQTPSAANLPEDVLVANASKVEAKAGKSSEAQVKLVIKEGYHINANPASQYQIATQLTVEQAEGVTPGQPKYPASVTKKFTFSEQPLMVYEKEAVISVPLNVAATAAKGERSLTARIRFQACDEQVCYPPKNMQVSIPLTVQ